jgi:hypothetical protein
VTIFVARAATAAVGVLPPRRDGDGRSVKLGALMCFVVILWLTRTMTRSEFTELRRLVFEMLPLRRPQPAG